MWMGRLQIGLSWLQMGEKKKKVLFGSISITSAVILVVSVVSLSLFVDSEAPNRNQKEINPWDIIVPDDFDAIQEAVDHAAPGDRILVKQGTYISTRRFFSYPLTIDKADLTICGENKSSTIISGRSIKCPVYIKADRVNFTGFTIKENGVNGSLLQVSSDKCIISNNIFISNDFFDGTEYGIVFYNSHENTVFNNIITDADRGLEIRGANDNYIFNNTFEGNDIGVDIGGIYSINFLRRLFDRSYSTPSINNIIKNNTFTNNKQGIAIGSSMNNQILNNYLDSKGRYGLILSRCSNCIINNNKFINDGLEIWGKDIDHYIHEIIGNTINGKPLYYYKNKNSFKVPTDAGQIILVNCNDVTIEKTKISRTTTAVLIVYSRNVRVRENEFSSNFRGIYLYYSTLCSIYYNNFINNSNHAYFISYGILNSRKNIWSRNYWDNWLGTISFIFSFTNKRIKGRIYLRWPFNIIDPLSIGLRTTNVDRRPLRKPLIL